MDRYEKAIAILGNTRDGDDLTPLELWIVQEAVNDHLNQKGWSKFEDLFQKFGAEASDEAVGKEGSGEPAR